MNMNIHNDRQLLHPEHNNNDQPLLLPQRQKQNNDNNSYDNHQSGNNNTNSTATNPDNPGSTAAICAIQKGAKLYLQEWIDYNIGIGFETIYIYDNSDQFELQNWTYHSSNSYSSFSSISHSSSIRHNNNSSNNNNNSSSSIRHNNNSTSYHTSTSNSSAVHIIHYPGLERQMEAYTHCVKSIQRQNNKTIDTRSSMNNNSTMNNLQQQQQRHSHSHPSSSIISWVAFFDVDEFLVIRNTTRYPNIMDVLQTLPSNVGGLTINWIMIYLNNQTYYKEEPVTKRFQYRSEDSTAINEHIKTIARVNAVESVPHPHFVQFVQQQPQQQSQQQQLSWWLSWSWWKASTQSSSSSYYKPVDTNGNVVWGPFNYEKPTNVLALYHYRTKSLQEFQEKCTRGRADVPQDVWKDEIACQSPTTIMEYHGHETVFDDSPWQLLLDRCPQYKNII